MLFEPQLERLPNKYPWTKDFIDVMWKGFWTPEQFTFTSDCLDYKSIMTEQQKAMVNKTLSAIAQIEVQVKTFWAQLGKHLPNPAIYSLGIVMAHVEEIHNRAYEKLLEKLHLEDMFLENINIPAIRNRSQYLKKYNEKIYEDDKKQFIYSLILFTMFTENVSLFSQFYVILWLNRTYGYLKDTANQIKYTRNEEVVHANIGIKIVEVLRGEYPEYFDEQLNNRVREEALIAFKAESGIVDWIVGDYNQLGLSAPVLKNYVKNRLKQSLDSLGFDSDIFTIDEELLKQAEWMDIGTYVSQKTDFFNSKPTEYTQIQTDDCF